MRWLATIAGEIWGLFVDDAAFAIAIVAWLAIAGLLLAALGWPGSVKGLILFAGLAVILVQSAVRRSRM